MTDQHTTETARLTNDEKETARLWLYAHNGDEGGGLGGLWQMVEQIIAGRADYVAGMACDGSTESCEDVKKGAECPYDHAARMVRQGRPESIERECSPCSCDKDDEPHCTCSDVHFPPGEEIA